MTLRHIAAIFSLVPCAACQSGDGGASSESSSDDAASGFTSFTATGSDAGTADSGAVETFGEGELRGILTFTYYAADAFGAGDEIGMAGAWRSNELGIEGLEDFHAIQRFGIWYPPPPAVDAIEHNAVPPGFDWGDATDWLLAGTAMKLRSADVEALACVLLVGGEYAVYESSASELHPAGCAPDVAWWSPDTVYDVVIYGGDLFPDNVLVEQVHTPAALVVTAPDPAQVLPALPQGQDLQIAWEAGSDPDSRIVVRLVDTNLRMITAQPADDGAFAIPAADLADLAVGPVDLLISRERIDDVPFTDGGLRVVSRWEARATLDLY
jgi:hypothetical protein